jgi:small subunit ribosomal protein S8
MSMTDPIADLLTRIRNAQMAGDETVAMPFSKGKAEIVKILEEEGYIFGHTVEHTKPFSTLTVHLKYQSEKDPIIRCLKRISKPGRRVYTRKDDIPVVLGGLGINIISTSKGVLTGKKAKQAGVGGEILCEVY